jgi:Bacterial SH3 domain
VRSRGAQALALLAVCVVLGGTARAEDPLYVVEQVVVSLNSAADGTGERVAALKSGDRVELIERTGDSLHVRLPDGRQGWVKALYLSADEPLRPRLAKSEAELTRLQAQVSSLESQLAATKTLGRPAAPAAEETPAAPVNALFAMPEGGAPVRLWPWALAAAAAGLAAGFALGWRVLDRRIRAKYGGLRIY